MYSAAAAYGATVTCGNKSSDASTIQAALNAGGTVTISGTCALGGTTLQVNKSMTVNGNATLNSSAGYAMGVNVDNVTVTGLTFNGAGVILQEWLKQSGFLFQYNRIQNTNGGGGIHYDGILINSRIDSNSFYYIAPNNFLAASFASLGFPGCWNISTQACDVSGTGIFIYGGMDQTNITNNSFDVVGGDAMHIGWNDIGSPSLYFLTKNNSISFNSMSRVHRIGLEIQAIWSWPYCGNNNVQCDLSKDYSTNTHIDGNYFHDPFLAYTSTFAYSLALWGDGQYVNNAALDNVTGTCIGHLGYGIEDMGNNVLTQGNVVASDYLPTCNPHGWNPITYGSSRAGSVFTTKNNVICGDQANSWINFTIEPNSFGIKINEYNYINNSCPNTGHLTQSAIRLNSLSYSNGTWNVTAVSTLPLKYVQFYLDNASTPFATQEVQDTNTNFQNDQTWAYHGSLASVGAGGHTLKAIATDVANATQTVTQGISSFYK